MTVAFREETSRFPYAPTAGNFVRLDQEAEHLAALIAASPVNAPILKSA